MPDQPPDTPGEEPNHLGFLSGEGGMLTFKQAATASLLRTIIETAPGLIYAKDAQGRMQLCNAAVLDAIGKPWTAVEGRTDAEFLDDPAQGAAVMLNDRRVLESGQPEEIEEVVSAPDQPPRIYVSRKGPLRNGAGEVIGVVGMSVDITRRKQLEHELRLLNATLEARVAEGTAERDRTWRNSQDLLCVIDADGIIRAANPAWTAVLGWLPEELIGRHHLDLSPPDSRASGNGALNPAMTGKLPKYENLVGHKDGSTRWIAWVATGEGGLVYASGRDVTAEREAADALVKAEDLLRQSQKMQAVGQLTGGIAHDFNNMLQSIASGVELMQRRIADGRPDQAERFIAITRQSIDRAAALTHRLLAFSRQQPLAPARIDLNHLVPEVCGLIRQTVGPSIDVRMKLDTMGWPVRCDPNQMENALLNLAINARDAMMPGGGTLDVTTCHAVLSREDVAGWENAEPGEFVCVSVADTGAGMTADILARAFEPFFTTKEVGLGTGLGLSQVFGFVSQTHGVVRLDSTLGEGTTVHLYLPRYLGEVDETAASALPSVKAGPVKDAVILLVEDETDVRQLATEALREMGAQVIEATNATDGLAALHRDLTTPGRRIDMLVTDVGLPGGQNGQQLADAAREVRPNLPVLLITGFAGEALAGDLELAAGVALLKKPFSLEALAERVSAALAG